ncbi:MAG TPA: sensor histidine kinase [Clostridia bacterium]|nr:sensor histidine kinase [Clostridia bacterium]
MKRSPAVLLKFYKNLSIRNKLISTLFVQILIPLVLIGYLSYKNSESIIKENSTNYSRDILNMIQLRLADYMDNLTNISQDLLYEDKIYTALKSSSDTDDPIQQYEYENTINSYLKMVVISRSVIRSICIFSNSGREYYQDDNTREAGSNAEIPYYDMLQKARLMKGKPYIHVVSENKKAKAVYLVRQINDRDHFGELGLLVIKVKTELLDEVYQGLTGNLQNILILSPDMDLIASKVNDDLSVYSGLLSDKINGEAGELVDDKSGLFVSYITLKNTGWKVVAYVTLDELYKDANTLRRNIIMLCIIVIFVLTVLTIFIAFDIVKPINKLVKGMKKVQAGESNVQIKDDRQDELGFLNKAFNEMSGEINHLVNWVYREQLTRKEAELKALQSQINPHFLFNTLEAINWLAQLNNVPEISNTVSDLSDLMEGSIGRDDRLITIKEEFTYADKYISLQKRRFGDRIELIKNIQPDVNSIKIPRLLIQPLIENAVYHGIERIRGKGVITLNAEKLEDSVFIEVIDNGAGMEQEDLEQLNERLAMDNDTYFKNLSDKRTKSIGIENVNRRIKLFYGESYGLKIESEAGKYTRAKVIIPFKISAEGGEGFYVQGSDN